MLFHQNSVRLLKKALRMRGNVFGSNETSCLNNSDNIIVYEQIAGELLNNTYVRVCQLLDKLLALMRLFFMSVFVLS